MYRKSQASTEYMVLIGLIMLIIVVLAYYTWKPKEEVTVSRADASLANIADSVNNVAELGPGNKIKVKVDIPKGTSTLNVKGSEIVLEMFSGSNLGTVLHKGLTVNLTGFFRGNITPGTYDLIFESMGTGVCVYPAGSRSNYCRCFEGANNSGPYFLPVNNALIIACSTDNGNLWQNCGILSPSYGTELPAVALNCQSEGSIVQPQVEFTITNWKGEVVFEDTVFTRTDLYYYLDSSDYIIENSGGLNITAKCIDECYYVANDNSNLVNTTSVNITVPYGTLRPFLLNSSNDRIYTDQSNYYLVDANSNTEKTWLRYGWVKSGDTFVIRTGYECLGGECLMVNASLYHGGTG